MDVKSDKYDPECPHYRCPHCGFWSTHPFDNHSCFLPKKIIRMDDGMEFVLNEDTKMYRIHMGIPHLDNPKNYHHEYSFEQLMGENDEGLSFKVADGTEDIQAMKAAWAEKMDILTKNDGHGDSDDI